MGTFLESMRTPYRYRRLIGVGGIGSGLFFALEEDRDLGRNESRAASLIDSRDYCKLHIVVHYLAVLLERELHIVPVAHVGNDSTGLRLIEEMNAVAIDTSHVLISNECSTLLSVCYQYPDGSGGNITASNSAATLLTPQDIDQTESLFEEYSGQCQCIALALPEVALDLRHHLLKLATRYNALRVAAFTSAEMLAVKRTGILEYVDLLFLNQDEAAAMIDVVFDPSDPDLFLKKCAVALRAIQPDIQIVVTAGPHGAYGILNEEWIHSPACKVNFASTAGAGDALIAGTLAGLISGSALVQLRSDAHCIQSALDFGVLLGSYSTTSPHTIHPGSDVNSLVSFAKDAGKNISVPIMSEPKRGSVGSSQVQGSAWEEPDATAFRF